jgi:pantetheine-phosphate adenylyltransferase
MTRRAGRLAVFPGTFDPVTHGHQDLILRALKLFDRLVVGVAPREEKGVLFTLGERVAMLHELTKDEPRVRIVPFEGLLVDFAAGLGADAVVRGLRAVSDFEFEFQMALMNRRLKPGLETVFLMPSSRYTYLNSTVVKEIARNGGSVRGLVAPVVARRLKARFATARAKGRGRP